MEARCAGDCLVSCGDEFCDGAEIPASCSLDCFANGPIGICGDGFCTENEVGTCANDCELAGASSCGDGACDRLLDEDVVTCAPDCG